MSDLDMLAAATKLSRNPLGIIALFIVMVYGFACLVLGVSGDKLSPGDQTIMVIFLATFPVLVLGVFGWLVSQHPNKLYAPRDYQDDSGFVAALGVGTRLAAAEASRTELGATVDLDVRRIAQLAAESVPRRSGRRASHQPRILWVDDLPQNNTQLRQAFEEAGVRVQEELSTESALSRLAVEDFDVVISDMGRREGPQEGYALLQHIRAAGNDIPFFIYAGSNLEAHRQMALERGAQGSTNRPSDLFQMVMETVNSGA